MTPGLPAVAVVIPVYNGGRTIGQTIAAVLAQTHRAARVVVVDDGSTDDTAAQVARAAGDDERVRVVRQANAGPAAARNLGVGQCDEPLVAFTDSDCVPTPGWLAALAAAVEPAGVAAAGGPVRGIEHGWTSRYMDAAGLLDPEVDRATGTVLTVVTANACFRRDVLVAVGGFSPRFRRPGGEEPELCMRIRDAGHRLAVAPAAVVHHHHRQSPRSLFRTLANYGRGRYVLATIRPELAWREASAGGLIVQSFWPRGFLGQVAYGWRRHGPVAAVVYAALWHVSRASNMWGYLREQRAERSPHP